MKECSYHDVVSVYDIEDRLLIDRLYCKGYKQVVLVLVISLF